MPAEINAALASIRDAAARIMGVHGYGIEPGCTADLVVLDSDDVHDALRLQTPGRHVIRRGAIVAATRVTSTINRGKDQLSGG
jgi:cytosine deaminase